MRERERQRETERDRERARARKSIWGVERGGGGLGSACFRNYAGGVFCMYS